MQKNDDAYLLHSMKIDCKSNKSQCEKALTVFSFSSRNSRPHLITALMCTTMFSLLTFVFKLIKSLAFNHRKRI